MAAEDEALPGVEAARDREPVDPVRLVWPGRIFQHRILTNPSNPGPQLCRVVAVTAERVAFHEIHRNPDGSERQPRVAPWNVPVRSFFEFDLGSWHGGPLPPVDGHASSGYDLPMSAKKPGTSGPSGH